MAAGEALLLAEASAYAGPPRECCVPDRHVLVAQARPEPCKVGIAVKPVPERGWKKATAAMAIEAAFSAKLLNGQKPEDIEKAVASARLSLFPEGLIDLETECTFPDWFNPCKHITAVSYLLAEEFEFSKEGESPPSPVRAPWQLPRGARGRQVAAIPVRANADSAPAPADALRKPEGTSSPVVQ